MKADLLSLALRSKELTKKIIEFWKEGEIPDEELPMLKKEIDELSEAISKELEKL